MNRWDALLTTRAGVLAACLAASAIAGAAFALAFPRGPQSGVAGCATVLVALALGVLIGRLRLRSLPRADVAGVAAGAGQRPAGQPGERPGGSLDERPAAPASSTPRPQTAPGVTPDRGMRPWTRSAALLVLVAWVTCEVIRWRLSLPSTWPLSPRLFTGSQFALGATLFGRGVDLLLAFLPFWIGLRLWTPRRPVQLVAAQAHTATHSPRRPTSGVVPNTPAGPGVARTESRVDDSTPPGVAPMLPEAPMARTTRRSEARATPARGASTLSKPFAIVAALLAALSATLLIGPSTPAALGMRGEIRTIRVGDCDHRVVLRGRPGGPLIFFLSGGPGGTEIGTIRNQWAPVERDAMVAVWDQTGAGLNGRCFPRDGHLTLDRLLADGEQIMDALVTSEHRRLIVVGNSWGTFLGVHLVQRRPDLVDAYVGTGQMVDLRETDELFYADTLAWARASGRSDVVAELEAQGPPPYPTITPYEPVFAHEGEINPWGRDPAVGAAVNPLTSVIDKPELDPLTKLRYPAGVIDSFSSLYPQVQAIDLRESASRLSVPVYLAAGVHEARGRAVVARSWFDGLQAPHKEWVAFQHSGHKPFGEEPDAFAALIRRVAAGG